ncbi:hypothetical protein J4460_03205 [Candidatus Woesearchaeota archaeon]|nr:MAG: small subunit ribosomal protein S24e [archaeon GW2011_AR4]MBS3129655.1 hypothetical protein [Candidatus Woesearchaeota archaeon]HIH38759.1 hypothetical protein [Candidatus Woesearchaeota archaeon]HIH49175.1 hypothetical protein [Candidatus Woesearchaeota archaeon]HIJ03317.1 hypothetical protein [Candidatus Woesearchaeota archaeon]
MTIVIIERKENKLLKRKELKATVKDQTTTPSRVSIIQALAKSEKAKPECIIIKSISTLYGSRAATIELFIYDSAESLQRIESIHKKSKKHAPEEKKKEGAE